jgi:radical SAM protein with 4Fe4S-binding SPASM domain
VSFKEGFYSLYPEIRSTKYQTDSKCRDCEIFYLCSQCPALAELENGNQEKPIDYFCNLAHKLAACEK